MEPLEHKAQPNHIGGDLQALVLSLGGEVACVEPITRLISPRQSKAQFKLTFADGRQFKGRRYESRNKRRRVSTLAPLLDGLPFTQIIAAKGRATLEEWVTGTTLRAAEVSEQQACDAGALLGLVHTREGIPPAAWAESPDVDAPLEKIVSHLDRISRGVAELSPLCEHLAELARGLQPGAFQSGLIHADYAVDNMIIAEDGHIIVVDNEHLRVGPLDYDLARCWSRWPMTESLRQAFGEGYQQHRSLEPFAKNRQFWAIRALSQSLSVHLKHGKSNRPVLEALQRVADGETDHLWPSRT
jgi:Ser/Thr protein kinase RdoA (MazF antagonist)